MNLLIENAKQVVTCNSRGKAFLNGKKQNDIGLVENSSIYIENGLISFIGKKIPPEILSKAHKKISGKNKVVFPGFIDSHTHLVFAGNRADEFSMRLAGKTYEEIAKAGGGIANTVNAVRKAAKAELKKSAMDSIKRFISFGITTIEAKSGYGLDTKNEIKMLETINELNEESPVDILPTLLGAHAVPKDKSKSAYIEQVLYEMIPAVARRNLAIFIDVFCEKNYFSPSETGRIFEQGIKFGLIPKLHTNQFHSIGGIETAVKNSAVSVDHLEALTSSEIRMLIGKNIVAALLPGVSYFLNIPYAPARKLIDNNIPVAISTDFNPGSCLTENIQLIMSLAAHKMDMSPEEIINAVTINAAAALGIQQATGSIEPGKKADFVMFDMPSYKHLFYHFGVNMIDTVIKNGNIIFRNN